MTSEINPIEQFNQECDEEIRKMGEDEEFSRLSRTWLLASAEYKYGYHFSWMGRPIIQLPTDMVMMQELIWRIKPDVIVETGIAHGGSLVFYASMLVLLDIAERGGGGRGASRDWNRH
ncbi:hypothetical protein AGMMS49957_16480 [Synergistales bacterium]|nr:hypothetical protein AGMMS49957_16480 [Synergistales bacterium]